MPRVQATCKWFKKDKNFGFLTPDNGDKDVFVHGSALMAAHIHTLNPGDRVSCEVQESPKGLNAINISLI